MNKAKLGVYSVINGKKTISIDFTSWRLSSFMKCNKEHIVINKTLFNPSGNFANSLTYHITDQQLYDFYLNEIKQLTQKDDINIIPVLVGERDKGDLYTFPCRIEGFALFESSYIFNFRCSISYCKFWSNGTLISKSAV